MPNSDTYRELTELVGVSESEAFKELLNSRKAYLQSEVNKFIRQKEWTDAYGTLCKLDDVDKTMDMLKKRIFDIRKES